MPTVGFCLFRKSVPGCVTLRILRKGRGALGAKKKEFDDGNTENTEKTHRKEVRAKISRGALPPIVFLLLFFRAFTVFPVPVVFDAMAS
jgi:hypothetical protein